MKSRCLVEDRLTNISRQWSQNIRLIHSKTMFWIESIESDTDAPGILTFLKLKLRVVFFRFFIRDKYLQIRHGCTWDLNSLPLFSQAKRHPSLACSFLALLARLCCADMSSPMPKTYLLLPLRMVKED